jgi:hypothetical protein
VVVIDAISSHSQRPRLDQGVKGTIVTQWRLFRSHPDEEGQEEEEETRGPDEEETTRRSSVGPRFLSYLFRIVGNGVSGQQPQPM